MRRTFGAPPPLVGVPLLRPGAASVPAGTQWLDRLSGVPQWSDGAGWRDAGGLLVPDAVAPVVAPALGTASGVPTGASLTSTSGLPASDATTSLLLVHPLTGAVAVRPAPTWRRRRWTATINPHPVGVTRLFDECEFNVSLDNFCVDLNDADGVPDLMAPLAVFRRCTFNGNSTTGKCLVGGFLWLINCHLSGAEDGWAGLYWSVAIGSSITASTDGQPDPHADGIQMSGIGHSVIYGCWLDAGQDSDTANAPLRVGTEFGAVTDVQVVNTTFSGSQHGAQFRGDAGAGDITGVVFRGNRWIGPQFYGPTDFQETTVTSWVDNAYVDGTPVPNPAP